MNKKLKRNIIRCRHCNDIIESKTEHDFKMCNCGKVAVNGGIEYSKRIFASNPPGIHFDDLSEYE